MDDVEALLPGGFWDAGGRLHRTAWLRPLTGHDEELLAAGGRSAPAAAVTGLLSSCLLRLGELEPVTSSIVRELLVADRDVLLLRLRQATFGDQVHADLLCPWPECGERVSLTFALSQVPVHDPPLRAATHTVRLDGGATDGGATDGGATDGGATDGVLPHEVTFRLPNGGDQEELSTLARQNEAAALTGLLARCVLRIDGDAPDAERIGRLGPRARAAIEAQMEHLAPRLERTLDTRCAECGRSFVAPIDLHRCFFGQLRTDADLLYREVHHLALHYHWSEAEIMSMPRGKRHIYLDVLSEELERMSSGA